MWQPLFLLLTISSALDPLALSTSCLTTNLIKQRYYYFSRSLVRGETVQFDFSGTFFGTVSMQLNATSLTFYWAGKPKFGTGVVPLSMGPVWFSFNYDFRVVHSVKVEEDYDPGMYIWMLNVLNANGAVVYCYGETVNLEDTEATAHVLIAAYLAIYSLF